MAYFQCHCPRHDRPGGHTTGDCRIRLCRHGHRDLCGKLVEAEGRLAPNRPVRIVQILQNHKSGREASICPVFHRRHALASINPES